MNPYTFQPFSPNITQGQQNPSQINPTVLVNPTLNPANMPFDPSMPILNLVVSDLKNISETNVNASFQQFIPAEQFASVSIAPPVQLPLVSSVTPSVSFQPAVTTPVSFQPAVTTPVSFQPAVTTPVSFQPAVTTPVSFQPAVTPPVSFQPAVTTPVSFQPAVTTPVSVQPAVTTPVSFQPAVTTPVSVQPAVTTPVSFQPAVTPPVSFQPAVTPPVSFQPAVTTPVSFQPAGTTSPIKIEKMTTGSSGFVPQKFSPQVSAFQPSSVQPSTFQSSTPLISVMDKPISVSGVNIPSGPILNVIPSVPTIGLGTPITLNIVEPEIKPMSLPEPPKSPLSEPEGVILTSPILSPSKFGQVNLPSEVVGTPLRSVSRPQIQSLPTAEAFTSQQKSVVGVIDIDLTRVSGGRGKASDKFYTKLELIKFLKDLGLPSGGGKPVLADRLHQHFTKK
jgi:Keratin, high sulfur B2 protein